LIASDAQAKRGASAPRFRFGSSSHSIGMKRAARDIGATHSRRSGSTGALLRRIDLTTLRLFTAVCEEKDLTCGGAGRGAERATRVS